MKITTGKKFLDDRSIYASYYIHPKGHGEDYTKFATLDVTLHFNDNKWKHLLNLCNCTATTSVKAYEGHPEDEPAVSLDGMLEPSVKIFSDDDKNGLKAHILVNRVIDLTKLWQSTTCRKDITIEVTIELEIVQDTPDVVELVSEDNVDSELVVISHKAPR